MIHCRTKTFYRYVFGPKIVTPLLEQDDFFSLKPEKLHLFVMASNVEVGNKKLTNKLEQKVLHGRREIKNKLIYLITSSCQIFSKVLCQKDDYTANRVWGF